MDEAEAKLKASQAATKAAEARVQEAQAALLASEHALALAPQQEKSDTDALLALKAAVQETPPPAPAVLPDTITSMLLALAANAGLDTTEMSTLQQLLGLGRNQSQPHLWIPNLFGLATPPPPAKATRTADASALAQDNRSLVDKLLPSGEASAPSQPAAPVEGQADAGRTSLG